MHYFREAEPGQAVRAVPGAGLKVPIWILGSSLFGAQLAAVLGLPYAFASHFAPGDMMAAIEIYRQRFQPSAQLERPYVMLGFNVFAADSDEEGQLIATSQQQAFVQSQNRQSGSLAAACPELQSGPRSRRAGHGRAEPCPPRQWVRPRP